MPRVAKERRLRRRARRRRKALIEELLQEREDLARAGEWMAAHGVLEQIRRIRP